MSFTKNKTNALKELHSLAHTVYHPGRADARIRFLHIVFAAGLYEPLTSGEIYTGDLSARTLHSCLEMGDAEDVITAVMHEARKDTILARGIRGAGGSMYESWLKIYNDTVEAHLISLELESADDNRVTTLKADRRDLDKIVSRHIDLLQDLPTSVHSLHLGGLFVFSLYDWQGEKLTDEDTAPIQIDYIHLHRNSYITIYLHHTQNNESYWCRYHPGIQVIDQIQQYPVHVAIHTRPS